MFEFLELTPPRYTSFEIESQTFKKDWDVSLISTIRDPKILSPCICPCATYGDISDQTGYGRYAVHCLLSLAGATLLLCLPNGVLVCLQRGHVRKSHNIHGSIVSDCLTSHVCHSCVLVQMAEQVKYNKGCSMINGQTITRE